MNAQGKRVLITGASGGLGTATMAALIEKGCKVVGIDRVASGQFKDHTIVAISWTRYRPRMRLPQRSNASAVSMC
jgi:NAD(P)-dependent dehydrogenase (short-subunit alcohol dehydrogenase family)